jgi:hypothetical protein
MVLTASAAELRAPAPLAIVAYCGEKSAARYVAKEDLSFFQSLVVAQEGGQ